MWQPLVQAGRQVQPALRLAGLLQPQQLRRARPRLLRLRRTPACAGLVAATVPPDCTLHCLCILYMHCG